MLFGIVIGNVIVIISFVLNDIQRSAAHLTSQASGSALLGFSYGFECFIDARRGFVIGLHQQVVERSYG